MPNVAKTIAQQAVKQIGKIGEDVFETAKKTPGEMAGKVLEQLGVTAGKTSGGQPKGQSPQGKEKTKLQQLEAIDRAKSQRRIEEIEGEIARWRRIREEQLRRRREETGPVQPPEEQPIQLPEKKQKRGGLFLRRKKSQTEMSGMKVSG